MVTQHKAAEVRARRSDLKKIEDLGAILEEHLILDNRYTEHSTVGLAQVRMQFNLIIPKIRLIQMYFNCTFFAIRLGTNWINWE